MIASNKYAEIRTTVRDASSNKAQFLKDPKLFPGLKICEADLTKDGSFDEVCKGATYVMHIASPFNFSAKNPQKDLVEPAVQGTENVLKAVEKAGTVKTFVW